MNRIREMQKNQNVPVTSMRVKQTFLSDFKVLAEKVIFNKAKK